LVRFGTEDVRARRDAQEGVSPLAIGRYLKALVCAGARQSNGNTLQGAARRVDNDPGDRGRGNRLLRWRFAAQQDKRDSKTRTRARYEPWHFELLV
jgi:hypothetical protein